MAFFFSLKSKISPIFSRFQVKNLSALPEADRLLSMPIFLFPSGMFIFSMTSQHASYGEISVIS